MVTEIGKSKMGSRHTVIRMWEVDVEKQTRHLVEHRHINFEIALVLEGCGIYNTPNGHISINKNDIFVFSSNEPHCITNINSNHLKLLNLHFSFNLIENNPFLLEKYPYIFYNHSKSFNSKISNDKKLINDFLEIKKELVNKSEGFQSQLLSFISGIFVHLVRNYNYYSSNDDISISIKKKLKNSLSYIDNHYFEQISLKEIAEQSSLTPNYFSFLFKECLNITVWEYITAKRIEKSKRLLKQTNDLTILEIAEKCGFNNTVNFNRSFKMHTGTTPTNYKRNGFENII